MYRVIMAVYAEAEWAESNWIFVNSLRYENYSDFGSNISGKSALALHLSPDFLLRSSIGTGFRAPSLSQSHFSYTGIGLIGGQLIDVGTYSIYHSLPQALGAQALEPETSQHFNLGFEHSLSHKVHWSLNWFINHIDDRIELTGNINQDASVWGDQVVSILQNANVGAVRFFSNAIDTTTQGFDLTLKVEQPLVGGEKLRYSMEYHHSKTKLDAIKTPALFVDQVSSYFNRQEKLRIENKLPQHKAIFNVTYLSDSWQVDIKNIYFGSMTLVNNVTDASFDQSVGSEWVTDINAIYSFSSALNLQFGANNVRDTMPDYFTTDGAFFGKDRIFQYSDHTPFSTMGRYLYLQLNYSF